MKSFLSMLVFGPSCTEILTGALTEAPPINASPVAMNEWRVNQYRERLKAHVDSHDRPFDIDPNLSGVEFAEIRHQLHLEACTKAELDVAQRSEKGMFIRAQFRKLWSREMQKRFRKAKSISTSKAPVNAVVCLDTKRTMRRASK